MGAANLTGKLKAKEVEALKHDPSKGRINKISDNTGVYLFILPSQTKTWYFIYSFGGKQLKLKMGRYPELSLQDARQKSFEYKRLLALGKDPKEEIKSLAEKEDETNQLTFKDLFDEWFDKRQKANKASSQKQILGIKKNHLDPTLAEKRITEITQEDLLGIVHNLENQKMGKMARLIARSLVNIFEYAQLRQYIETNIAENLIKLLENTPNIVEHRAAITDLEKLRIFLNRIDRVNFCLVNSNVYILSALNLVVLLGCRVNELLGAKWDEVDFDKATLTIPSERMKTNKEHVVYLSNQAITYLKLAYDSRVNDFIIYGISKDGHLTNKGLLKNLRDNCLIDPKEATLHGFRATMQSIALNLAAPKELIDHALSHCIGNQVFQAYLRTQALEDRMRHFWQWWADTIDAIKAGKAPKKWFE